MIEQFLNQTLPQFYDAVPRIIGAVVLFIVGLILAAVLRSMTRGILVRFRLDALAARAGLKPGTVILSEVLSKLVYYLALLFVLLGVFQILRLELISGPIQAMLNKIAAALPNILHAAFILGIAWVIASVLRALFAAGLARIGFDRRAGDLGLAPAPKEGAPAAPAQLPSAMVGQAVFYLVLLFALPGVLGALNLGPINVPLEALLTRVLVFIPNLLGAAITIAVGWVVARLVRGVVANGLAALGADRLAQRLRLDTVLGAGALSGLVGWVLYYLILLWAVTAGLNNLQLEAISQPLAQMMALVAEFVPRLAAAGIIVIVGIVVGRLVRDFTAGLLGRIGLDALMTRLGIQGLLGKGGGAGAISSATGSIAMVVVVFLFVAQALDVLKLQLVTQLAGLLLQWLPQVLIGMLIVGVGLAVANWSERRILAGAAGKPQPQRAVLAMGAKYAIMAFVLAGAMQQMGIAREVVVLTFGLAFGAVCLGLALAFGLGSREVAGEYIRESLRRGSQ